MLNLPKAFTPGVSKAIIQAQISAASMGSERLESCYLLIGLCRAGDELTKCLLPINVKEIENEIEAIFPRTAAVFSHVRSMSPHTHRILARTVSYANLDKKTLAGTAHLWLELLEEEGCSAHRVLDSLGKDVNELRAALFDATGQIDRTDIAKRIPASDQPLAAVVVHIRQENGKNHTEGVVQSTEKEEKTEKQTALEKYSINLTEAARQNKLEPLIGRESEVAAMVRILGKKTKNNPMLIGEPGVGKSALVEGLAQRIAGGSVPEILKDAQIHNLDLTQMVAGSKYRGEFEDRIKQVLECAQNKGNVVLFIDEIHTLIGTGASEGSLDAANMLKPALARGQLRIIGATTHKEYQKYIEKDPALARRFQRIDVREPSIPETLEILRGLKDRLEEYHHVTIADEAVAAAVSLSARYVTDRFMPDKAIDLIDEAASMVRLSEAKSEAQPFDGDNERLVAVDKADIARIVSEWTGIPFDHIHASLNGEDSDLEAQLNRRVIGQEEAVGIISKAIRRSRAGLNDPNKPLGVFMLLGPSGVGKTELSKALSAALFLREDALIRIDMSEYSEEASVARLIGSPPGYVGHGDGGQLTDAVLKKPYSVILFDEVEKAHPKVFNLLLQLLDDGLLTDSVGRRVNFKNTIIMMTSNAGISFEMEKQLGFVPVNPENLEEKRRKTILEKAKQIFRPEFLGRIDEMIVMRTLSTEAGKKIAALMLDQVAGRLSSRGVHLTYTDAALSRLTILGINPTSGARNLKRVLQEQIVNPLCDLLLSGKAGNEIRIDYANDEIQIYTLENALI